jgi:class 3 adenylate cyclase
MFSLLCYVVLYYNLDAFLQQIYLPLFNNNNNNNIIISSDTSLFFSLKTTSIFMICLYIYQLYYVYFNSKIINKTSVGLTYVYIKYLLDILIRNNTTIMEYETSRTLMWIFTTPLMLKLYCETNDLTLLDINIHYHIISITPLMFLIPFKNENYNSVIICLLYIPGALFMNTLYKFKNLPFTNLFMFIWSIFMIINILDLINICDKNYIHFFYNLSDTLCKFICNVVISNYNEQEIFHKENMDLQSVNFVSYIIKSIKTFEINNKNLTPFCSNLIKYVTKKFIQKIPTTNNTLKLELLKKILPFDLDKDYLNANANANANANTNANANANTNARKFENICVLFMDIINYTELANKFDSDTIFLLLNNIYNDFDDLIKKYYHLQKIETIGDAYMVVGDIFRNEQNEKVVIQEIILLGLDFIKGVKKIQTPDNIPLSIRIGINMGSVNIGILGNEIPRLCVVGNTVNVASRLQSTADRDVIQISENIYEISKNIQYDNLIEYHKKTNVFLKNIGMVTTYSIYL